MVYRLFGKARNVSAKFVRLIDMSETRWYQKRDEKGRFLRRVYIKQAIPVKQTANRTLEDVRDYRRRATFPEVLDLLSQLRKTIKESMAFEPDEWVVLDSICRISLLKISRLQDELREKGLLDQL